MWSTSNLLTCLQENLIMRPIFILNIFCKMPHIHDSQFFSCNRAISSSIWWKHKLQASLIIQFHPVWPAPSLSAILWLGATTACREAGSAHKLKGFSFHWQVERVVDFSIHSNSAQESLVLSQLWTWINVFRINYFKAVKNTCIWFYSFWNQRKKHILCRNKMGHWNHLTLSKNWRF